jgi:hypothetical protein
MRGKIGSYKELPKEYKPAFKKMFDAVGGDIKSFNFAIDDWYYAYWWTDKQEEEFKKWLKTYLNSRIFKFNVSDRQLETEAAYFLLNWGWCSEHGKERVAEWRSKNKFIEPELWRDKLKRHITNFIAKMEW